MATRAPDGANKHGEKYPSGWSHEGKTVDTFNSFYEPCQFLWLSTRNALEILTKDFHNFVLFNSFNTICLINS